MAFPDDLLVDGERVALHAHPHWSSQLGPALAFPAVSAAVGFLAATIRLQPWASMVWIVLAVLGAATVVRWTVLPLARWRATHIVVTDQRLLVREGIMSRRGLDVPIGRICSVRVRATLRERIVGAGTLIVETGDGPPMRFTDVGRIERVQARLHREIGRADARSRAGTGSETGAARAVPERSAS